MPSSNHRAVGASITEAFEQPAGVIEHEGRHRVAVDVVRRPGPAGDVDWQVQRHDLVANVLVDHGFREEHLLGDGVETSQDDTRTRSPLSLNTTPTFSDH